MRNDVAIPMTWDQWKFIDATMDNTRSIAAEDLLTEVVDRTSAIRRVGWEATHHIDGPYMDRGEWPPPESVHAEPVTVTLSRDDWRFVLEELRGWSEVADGESEEDWALAELINSSLESGSEPDRPLLPSVRSRLPAGSRLLRPARTVIGVPRTPAAVSTTESTGLLASGTSERLLRRSRVTTLRGGALFWF